ETLPTSYPRTTQPGLRAERVERPGSPGLRPLLVEFRLRESLRGGGHHGGEVYLVAPPAGTARSRHCAHPYRGHAEPDLHPPGRPGSPFSGGADFDPEGRRIPGKRSARV
ncbi:MAG: Transcriptional regulator, ArsR family, partial [uncultured Cytophagales bacterium]